MEQFFQETGKLDATSRAGYLISGFLRKTLTIEEEGELDQWILADETNMKLFEDLTEERAATDFLAWYSELNVQSRLDAAKAGINFRPPSRTSLWQRYAAVALVVVLLGTGFYLLRGDNGEHARRAESIRHYLLPGQKIARLQLGDGRVISLHPGIDTSIDNILSVRDGEVIYNESNSNRPVFHEIDIPKGSRYKLRLPDGSRVWINAGSSVRYGIPFSGRERRVTVTGETYFEVAKDAHRPFVVSVNQINIRALGTRFNICAYPDEPFLRTTLLEGSIRVTGNNQTATLRQGEEIRIRDTTWTLLPQTMPVTDWKDDRFRFENASIGEVMRPVARWYDATVRYEGNVTAHFNATIDRAIPVTELLRLLEQTGHVHFLVDKNIIIVRP